MRASRRRLRVQRRAASSVCLSRLILRSAHAAKVAANRGGRARVSKDGAAVHPSCFETAAAPPPQHEGHHGPRHEETARSATKRVHDRASGMFCKAGLWKLPVFVLFRPVIDGRSPRPERQRPRGFPVCIPQLTGKGEAPGCGRPPVFLLLFTGTTAPRGIAFARCRGRRG